MELSDNDRYREFVDLIARFDAYMSADEDLLPLILKGHLLLEEVLVTACNVMLRRPGAISWQEGRYGFYVKIRLLEALYGDAAPAHLLNVLEKYNMLRNNAAHNLNHLRFEKNFEALLIAGRDMMSEPGELSLERRNRGAALCAIVLRALNLLHGIIQQEKEGAAAASASAQPEQKSSMSFWTRTRRGARGRRL